MVSLFCSSGTFSKEKCNKRYLHVTRESRNIFPWRLVKKKNSLNYWLVASGMQINPEWISRISDIINSLLAQYHNAPLQPPQNFAYSLFAISPGTWTCPKSNLKQCLCKFLWGKWGALWGLCNVPDFKKI